VGGTGAFPYVRDSNGSIYNDGGYDGMKFFQDNQSTYHFATDVDWILKRDATLSVSQNSSANASVAHNNMQPTLFAGNTFIKY
jgi:microcystin-dependent protein